MTQPGQVHGAREAAFGLPMAARGVPAGVFAFTTAATTTWQVPEGVEFIHVEVRGGSGGGDGATNIGIGGNGALAISYLKVAPGQVFTVVTGAAGNNSAGGASTFSGNGITTMTANGGAISPAVASGVGTGGTATGGNVLNVRGGGPSGGAAAGLGEAGSVVIWV